VTWFQILLGVSHIVLAVVVSAHIVLTKNDVRAAIGWTGLVWLTPVVGSVLYGLFGINRIRRQAGMLRRGRALAEGGTAELAALPTQDAVLAADTPSSLQGIAAMVGRATGLPLTSGNAVEPLVNGDEAYPAMLAAIDAAARSVWLATYIFDRGQAGDQPGRQSLQLTLQQRLFRRRPWIHCPLVQARVAVVGLLIQRQSGAPGAAANLHAKVLYGRSNHHKIEAIFKCFARAMRYACSTDERLKHQLPSTKGLL